MAGELRSGDRTLLVPHLQERAARAATGLASLGVKERDTVALLLRNDLGLFEASLGAQQLGAFATPINWHGKPEEVGYVVRDCGTRVLVAHADLLLRNAGAIPPGVTCLALPTPPEVRLAYGLTPALCEPPAGALLWDDWVAGFPPRTEAPVAQRASMIYTSGTTGHPKGVRRQPAAGIFQERRFLALRECWGFAPDMRCVMTGPMYHSAPNAYGLAAVNFASLIVLQPRFDAEELLALIARHRITHMHMVPTMFVRLLRLPESLRRAYDLTSLRWVIHGAAPCPREIKRAMIEWWGPVIYEYYGSTEGGVITCTGSADWLARPGTVGRPAPMVSVRIVDGAGRDVPPGTSGVIYSRNESIPDFTYHQLDTKRRDIEREGFITSGDIGYCDADGYLYLNDRKIDMVISGGVNIYPAEIEAALLQMPGIQDCAVFGIPDEEFGERVAAAVQPVPGTRLTPEAVQAHVREHLAEFKVPRVIEFLHELPREDSGKIFKRKLREPYWKHAGRSI